MGAGVTAGDGGFVVVVDKYEVALTTAVNIVVGGVGNKLIKPRAQRRVTTIPVQAVAGFSKDSCMMSSASVADCVYFLASHHSFL